MVLSYSAIINNIHFKMRCSLPWHCAFLAFTLLFLHFVADVLNEENANFYNCPNDTSLPEKFKPLKNCNAAIISGKVHVQCNLHISSADKLPLFTNATAALLVTDYMKSYQDLDDILTQQFNSSCMKFESSRIQKLNFSESEILKSRKKQCITIPKELFIPLMLIQLMDIEVVFNSEYANLHFNKTCLLAKNATRYNLSNPNDSLDATSCIESIDVRRRFVDSGEKFKIVTNLRMEDLFTKDFVNFMLFVVTEIGYIGFEFIIPSIAIRTGLLKYLPTKALTLLSKKNVSSVDFRGNVILSVRNGDIPPMDTLRTLVLADCQIETIEANAFVGLAYLKTLNLQGNKLTELPYAFQALLNIETLNLLGNGDSKTKEFHYTKNIIGPKSTLRNLDLSHMVLSDFWENLGYLSNLEQLNITNCFLNDLPIAGLSYMMPRLIYLNLSGNSLQNLSIQSLSGLKYLQILDLSLTGLSNIKYNSFIDALSSLQNISLSSNGILEFLPITLNNHSSLRSLDLNSNKITSWNQTMIHASKGLLDLNLIGNNITEVNSYMLADFNSLSYIQLADNPFDCNSCAMKNFISWLQLVNASTDFPRTPYKCFFPKSDFEKLITNVTLDLCLEEVLDWITNALVPVVVIVVLLVSVTALVFVYRWHLLYFIYLFQAEVQKYRRRDDCTVFKFDAFVSYCTADRNWVVDYLIPVIEKQDPKFHLCVHERDFVIGETIMNNVIECIDNSHKSIFVLSKSFIQSQWCQWEFQMAQHKLFEDKRDVLILVMLGDINEEETPKILKRLISKRTYLQWPVNENGHRLFWKRMKDAIGQCKCGLYNE